MEEDEVFEKGGVTAHEHGMQHHAALVLPDRVPAVLAYDAAAQVLRMRRIRGSTLAQLYGGDAGAVPPSTWAQVHGIVAALLAGGVIYPDINARNFMVEAATGTVFVIDFEHAYPRDYVDTVEAFVAAGGGAPQWNDDF